MRPYKRASLRTRAGGCLSSLMYRWPCPRAARSAFESEIEYEHQVFMVVGYMRILSEYGLTTLDANLFGSEEQLLRSAIEEGFVVNNTEMVPPVPVRGCGRAYLTTHARSGTLPICCRPWVTSTATRRSGWVGQ